MFGICLAFWHPGQNFPRPNCLLICVLIGWEAQEAARPRKKTDTAESPALAPAFPASRSLEPCGRFRRVKCNNAKDRCASRYRLATDPSLPEGLVAYLR